WRVHYPAMMLLDERGHGLPVRLQSLYGSYLILAYEAAIAFDVGAEDGGEFAFKALLGHGITPIWVLGSGRELACIIHESI
ncbi:MAG: hypothetical protein GTO12_06005, partial [Proteobacteria bacterium]|nr:hypothetical protein [Pseudomonadota bacterium]